MLVWVSVPGEDPSEGPNPWECNVSVSWDSSPVENTLGAVGHWECAMAPPDIEIQLTIYRITSGKKQFFAQDRPQMWEDPGEGVGHIASSTAPFMPECDSGQIYQIRVWGRTWDAFTRKTNFVGKAYDGHTEVCPGRHD